MKYIFDMVDFMSEIYFMKMFKIYSIHFSNIFWLGGNMNAQIHSDRVDLTSETYFIQIFPPWKPENSFMAKGSSKYQRHWSVTMWVFTPFFHSNNWKCCPKSLIIEWRVDEIAISLFMCPSILYLLGGIIFVFFVLLVSEIPIFLPPPLSAHNFFTISLTLFTISPMLKGNSYFLQLWRRG